MGCGHPLARALRRTQYTHRHELPFPLRPKSVPRPIKLHPILALRRASAQENLKVMFLALLLRPCPNMSRDLRPVPKAIQNESGNEQELLVGSPILGEYRLGMLFLEGSISRYPSRLGRGTYDDLVVMPSFMSLDLPALAEASRTKVHLLTLLGGAFDPNRVGDINVA